MSQIGTPKLPWIPGKRWSTEPAEMSEVVSEAFILPPARNRSVSSTVNLVTQDNQEYASNGERTQKTQMADNTSEGFKIPTTDEHTVNKLKKPTQVLNKSMAYREVQPAPRHIEGFEKQLRTTTSPDTNTGRIFLKSSLTARSNSSPGLLEKKLHTEAYFLQSDTAEDNHVDPSGVRKELTEVLAVTTGTSEAHIHSPLFDSQYSAVQRQRIATITLRSKSKSKRRELSIEETHKVRVEDELFQKIHLLEFSIPQSFSTPERLSLIELIKEYQKIRDRFGPLLSEYSELENQLEIEEYELQLVEERFFRNWRTGTNDQYESPKTYPTANITSSEDSTLNLVHLDKPNTSVLEDYLSRQGDRDLIVERLHDIVEEQKRLVDEHHARALVGLVLAEEDQMWLDGAEDMYLVAEKELATTDIDVEILRTKCLELGLIEEDEDIDDYEMEDSITSSDDDSLGSIDEASEYVKHPTILPKPLARSDAAAGPAVQSGQENATAGVRINEWLLERLRTSALEVNLLARIYHQIAAGEIDDSAWEILVLRYWFADDTLALQAYSSVQGSTHSPRTERATMPPATTAKLFPQLPLLSNTRSASEIARRTWEYSDKKERSLGISNDTRKSVHLLFNAQQHEHGKLLENG